MHRSCHRHEKGKSRPLKGMDDPRYAENQLARWQHFIIIGNKRTSTFN